MSKDKKKERERKYFEIPWKSDSIVGRLSELDRLYAESDARIARRDEIEGVQDESRK